MTVLSTEWRPAHQTLEHDGPQTPPITVECVAVPREDLRGNVVGGSNGRIRHEPSASSPVVDLGTVRYSQVDLVQGNRVTIARPVRLSLQELLVIIIVVELVEARGQTEISELDMTTAVEENIVGLDISELDVSRLYIRTATPKIMAHL